MVTGSPDNAFSRLERGELTLSQVSNATVLVWVCAHIIIMHCHKNINVPLTKINVVLGQPCMSPGPALGQASSIISFSSALFFDKGCGRAVIFHFHCHVSKNHENSSIEARVI